jgi:peptidoglycan hydrolase-like protein with peptidoglycan-binding domain
MSLFSLNESFGSDYTVNPDDIVNTKTALNQLGYYDPPEGIGIQPWTDEATFNGIKNFQQNNDLKVDGFMRPGGPTEATINKQLASAKNNDNWEYDSDVDKGDSRDVTTHGPVKVEIHNPTPGLNGLEYKVDWYGNDANGNVIPEYRRPDHSQRQQPQGGHILRQREEKVYHPPFDNPNGYTFRLNYPPQSEYTTLGNPPYLKIYRTKKP